MNGAKGLKKKPKSQPAQISIDTFFLLTAQNESAKTSQGERQRQREIVESWERERDREQKTKESKRFVWRKSFLEVFIV